MTIEVVNVRIGADAVVNEFLARETPLPRPTLFRMKTLAGRSLVREIMDTPVADSSQYTRVDLHSALRSLNRLHQFLFFNGSFYTHMRRAAPRSVIEIGCGGGYLARAVARMLPDTRVTAVDRNSEAIEFCKSEGNVPANLSFECRFDQGQEPCDIVFVHDVAHHMDDEELTDFLRTQYNRVRHSLVIIDLHRHWLASLLW